MQVVVSWRVKKVFLTLDFEMVMEKKRCSVRMGAAHRKVHPFVRQLYLEISMV